MIQGSEEWLHWREQGIGGSDVSALFNKNPWRTKYELWLEKTKRDVFSVNSFITEKGHEYEKVARALLQVQENVNFPPRLAIHSDFLFMRVSLDGWNEDLKRTLEIKFMGKAEHLKVEEGIIPEKYWYQIQYQMLVVNAKDCFFCSFNPDLEHDSDRIKAIIIKPCRVTQLELMNAVKKFWSENIMNDIRPELTVRDYLRVKSDERADCIFSIHEDIKAIEDHLKGQKELLHAYCDDLINQFEHDAIQTENGIKIKKLKTTFRISKLKEKESA